MRRNSGSVRDIARRGVLNKHLQRHRQVFVDNRYLSENDGETLWRVTARAKASKRLDYDEIQQQVRQRVDTFVKEYVPEAERVASRAVTSADDQVAKANYLDTLAELVNLRGDRAEAQNLIEQALALDPGSSHLLEQQKRFSRDADSGENGSD